MRFRIGLLFIGICFFIRLGAQCPIPNGNFEVLEDLTDTLSTELDLHLTFPVTAPEGWIPLLRRVDIALSDFIVPFYDKDTLDLDVFSGIKSYAPGANGTDKAVQLAGDEFSFVSDIIQSFPCQSRPEKVVGYYKYEGSDLRDSLSILVLLKDKPDLNEEDAIGLARFNAYGGSSEYTRFEATIEYRSDEVPDSAIILIASDRYEAWPNDSSFYVIDEIEFEGGIVPTDDYPVEEKLFLSPNPVINAMHLNEMPANNSVLTIYNEVGQLVRRLENISTQEITFRDFAPGLYFALLQSQGQVSVQKFIKHN